MALSEEHRTRLLHDTKEAASAFLDDVAHLREIAAKANPTRSEIRRMSVVLRRILVDQDIRTVATPRLGKVLLRAPDNNPAYASERKRPFLFFASARVNILDGGIGTVCIYRIRQSPLLFTNQRVDVPDVDVEKTVDLTLDSFLTQRVLCLRGEWVSRRAVIKYTANITSGAHSGRPSERDEKLLAVIRSSVIFQRRGEGIHLELFKHGINSEKAEFDDIVDGIDAVLVEVLATASFLTQSPFVLELEEFIRNERL